MCQHRETSKNKKDGFPVWLSLKPLSCEPKQPSARGVPRKAAHAQAGCPGRTAVVGKSGDPSQKEETRFGHFLKWEPTLANPFKEPRGQAGCKPQLSKRLGKKLPRKTALQLLFWGMRSCTQANRAPRCFASSIPRWNLDLASAKKMCWVQDKAFTMASAPLGNEDMAAHMTGFRSVRI